MLGHSGCPMRIEAAGGLYPFWAGLFSRIEVKVIVLSNTYKGPLYLLFGRGIYLAIIRTTTLTTSTKVVFSIPLGVLKQHCITHETYY